MNVLVVGGGGHAKVVVDVLQEAGCAVVGIVDDASGLEGAAVAGVPVLGSWARLPELRAVASHALVAIGDNAVRVEKAAAIEGLGFALVTAVHPRAVVSRRATLGAGSVVMAGAVVNADVRAGRCTIINTGATVDHDCRLAEGVHISPGAHLAGGVRVGARSHVGIGASVIEMVTIGAGVVVGAGAAVVDDVPDDAVVVGVPARALHAARR